MSSREARYFNSHHRIKNDYYKKSLNNPYRQRTQFNNQRAWFLGFKLWAMVILIVLSGLIWLLYYSSVFTISKVNIAGLTRTSEAEIQALVAEQLNGRKYGIFFENNLFVFSSEKLAENLKNRYNFIKVDVSKKWFQTLKINIQEREYAYAWLEADKAYYIDSEAHLINEIILPNISQNYLTVNTSTASSTEISTSTATSTIIDLHPEILGSLKSLVAGKYPIIDNQGDNKLVDKKIDVDNSYFALIAKLLADFKANSEAGLVIDYFIINHEFNTLKAVLTNNLTVYFSVKEDADHQVKSLFVLKKELKGEFDKLIKKKIDLRYGERVYYE